MRKFLTPAATAMASSVCDDSFGPHAGDCRGGFDLTLLFEESILVVPVNALLLVAAPCRVLYLVRKNIVKVENSRLLYCKIASPLLRGLTVSRTLTIFRSYPFS